MEQSKNYTIIMTTRNTTFIKIINTMPSNNARTAGKINANLLSNFLQSSEITAQTAKEISVAGTKTKIATKIPPSEFTQTRITVYIPKNNPRRYKNINVRYLNLVK